MEGCGTGAASDRVDVEMGCLFPLWHVMALLQIFFFFFMMVKALKEDTSPLCTAEASDHVALKANKSGFHSSLLTS